MNILTLAAIFIHKVVCWSHKSSFQHRINKYKNISSLASVGIDSHLIGPADNFYLGDYSYINQGSISWGGKSKVVIGSGCAIGYNVSIKAITHSSLKPTNNIFGSIDHIEKDIVIGDNVWIGDNAFIREGVVIGDNTIIGANSVVTKSFQSNSVIAGIPAKFIKRSVH